MKRNGILILMTITLVMSACKKKGCTDPTATNYDTEAEKDDGSCTYAQIVEPITLDCNLFNQAGTSYDLVDLGLDVDYIVDCKMAIYCDLKIMPGVTIAFKTDAGLKVYPDGSIKAVATPNSSILLTGVDKVAGSWAGIYVGSNDVKNEFSDCIVEYAGGDSFNSNDDKGAFILYANSSMDISNTTIQNCMNYGVNANYGGCSLTFNSNTISSCAKPMFIAAEYGGSIAGGTFTGNTIDVIYVDTYGGQADIMNSQTWTNLNVPYRMLTGAVVQSKCDWVIDPGVIMEFEPGSGILVNTNNSLKAVGTLANEIIFRGVNTGTDAWKNIKFTGLNSLNEIGYSVISGSGENSSVTKGCLYLFANAKLDIYNIKFNDNSNCGVYGYLNGGQTANPNYTSSNLTFSNTGCTELFE
jgi:hypothetical protein